MSIFTKLNRYIIPAFLILLFIGSVVIRLYRFNGPVADWMSWRQADTAAVTRNFVKEGFTPLYPKFDAKNSLNDNQQPNPNRYFFAEFPLYNILTYIGFTQIGHFTIEEWGRIWSIFFSSLTATTLYFLVKQYSSKRVAIYAAFIYAFLPFNIYYGRVILPDPMYVFFSVLSLYLVTLWVRSDRWWLALLAGIAFDLAILEKPYALILLLPIAYLALWQWKFSIFRKLGVYLFTVVGLVFFLLWRYHINLYPEGQFATGWLYNQGNIRFTGAYFRYLIYDRMNRLIFATGGFALFWIGVISGHTKREGLFFYTWLVGIAAFFVVIAKGNVTHDYYQMPLVPIGCIFIAKGLDYILNVGTSFHQRIINIAAALALVLCMFAFGWYEVRDYFNINHWEIVQAGQAANKLLPKNALVITPYQFDSSFLYQTNRYGWTIGGEKIPEWIRDGAQYLVSVNYDDATNYWMKHCSIVTKNSKYVIVNLTNCHNVDTAYAATLTGI